MKNNTVSSTRRLLCYFSLLILSSQYACAQHAGAQGEDAPGGVAVKINSLDIDMHGVLYKPEQLKSDELKPALIFVHGFYPYGARAGEAMTYWAKDIANEGYITLAITLRGWPETGGRDDCGLKQADDLANAITWLSNHKNVDPNRIGLIGSSQGGMIVLSAGALSDSVKAIAAYFPVTDVNLWAEETDMGEMGIKFYINGICSSGGTQRERSPLFAAPNIAASVLLLHGDADTRVPIRHSELMLQALLDAGKNASLHKVPGGMHGRRGEGWNNHESVLLKFFAKNL